MSWRDYDDEYSDYLYEQSRDEKLMREEEERLEDVKNKFLAVGKTPQRHIYKIHIVYKDEFKLIKDKWIETDDISEINDKDSFATKVPFAHIPDPNDVLYYGVLNMLNDELKVIKVNEFFDEDGTDFNKNYAQKYYSTPSFKHMHGEEWASLNVAIKELHNYITERQRRLSERVNIQRNICLFISHCKKVLEKTDESGKQEDFDNAEHFFYESGEWDKVMHYSLDNSMDFDDLIREIEDIECDVYKAMELLYSECLNSKAVIRCVDANNKETIVYKKKIFDEVQIKELFDGFSFGPDNELNNGMGGI